jgi:hypothetical protein
LQCDPPISRLPYQTVIGGRPHYASMTQDRIGERVASPIVQLGLFSGKRAGD